MESCGSVEKSDRVLARSSVMLPSSTHYSVTLVFRAVGSDSL